MLALEYGQATQDHMAHLAAHADIIRRLHKDGHVNTQAQTIMRMVATIMQRPDTRVAKAEEQAIRAAVQVTLPAMMMATNFDVLRASMAALNDHDRWGGVRV